METTKTIPKQRKVWWLFAVGLLLLSIAVHFTATAYRFSTLIGAALALTVAYYLLVGKLAGKRPKLARVLTLAMSLCLGLGILAAAVTGCIVYKGSLGDPEGDFDYLLVLGCGVDGDQPSLSLRNRIDAAYRFLADHPNVTAVVSGGLDDTATITEAECMRRELTAMGIAPERILMEEQATSTEENFALSLERIRQATGTYPKTLGVVSSEYHLYRAGMFAKEQGVTACGVPAKTSKFSLFLNYFLREIAMVWYYSLF